MVRTLQAYRTGARRDRTRESRFGQSGEGQRGRKPESFVQIQYSRDSVALVLQEWATSRSGERHDEQKGTAHPAGSAGIILGDREFCTAPERDVLPKSGARSFPSRCFIK